MRFAATETEAVTGRGPAYTHTPASLSVSGDDGAVFWHGFVTGPLKSYWRAAEYLRTHTAEETRDPRRSAFAWSYGLEGLTFFETLERDAWFAPVWKRAMELMARMAVVVAPGMFPWREALPERDDDDRVFVVDVGGGRGGALVEIMAECGGVVGGGGAGKMVLEDLAFTLEGDPPVRIEGVTNLVHDFFAEPEQPVKSMCPPSARTRTDHDVS